MIDSFLNRAFLPGAIALACLSAPALSREPEASSPVEATVSALEAGDDAKAKRLITTIEHAWLTTPDIWTPAQAIAALSGCRARELGRVNYEEHEVVVFRWRCGRQEYSGAMVANPGGRTVTLADIAPGRGSERLLTPPPIPPVIAPPRDSDADAMRRASERLERIQLAHAKVFAQMLVDGDFEAAGNLANEYSRSSISFQDPLLSEGFVEMHGADAAALTAQLAWIKDTLGTPLSSECSVVEGDVRCVWQLSEPGNQLMAFVGTGFGTNLMIREADFRYSTREKLREVGADEDTVLNPEGAGRL